MGNILVKLFEFTNEQGGLPAKMRVAMITGIPSTKAAETPDTAEVVAKFRVAIKEATGKDAPNF